MVVAGGFLMARLELLYSLFPEVQLVTTCITALTCVLGASIALTRMDLKKGLACSTVSRPGYMMLAMSCGATTPGHGACWPVPRKVGGPQSVEVQQPLLGAARPCDGL